VTEHDDRDFAGTIGTTVDESVPWWPMAAHDARPNVVLVILDDTGWSDFGCFGSEIETPNIDALAESGIRCTNFHVTPLCSPTRAAVLTGRNHHAVGMRFLADTDTGFPNSRGSIRADIPLLPSILREYGYASYLVGKWHLAPLHEITPAGPYRNWPLARGFDRYYGFLDGCTDQYEPELYEDNHPVAVPTEEGYHLSQDLADHAIAYLRDHVAYRGDSPFFLQLALGATHAPFQAPREYIDKYLDVFTKGWDRTRRDRLARQIEAGLVPSGTRLTDRVDDVRPWTDLEPDEQRVAVHLQSAFAGFLDHADAQIGRVVDALTELSVRNETIVLVMSDNGASREGGPLGDVDTNAPYSGVRRTAAEQLSLLDEVGTITGGAHYPEGWAMAGNTPFRYYKQFVDLGGVRSPLVISWSGAPSDLRGIRNGFIHAVDVAPTLLDLLGIPPEPGMDGASVADHLAEPSIVGGRPTQYWETLGHRAIWHDGYKAVTAHTRGDAYADDIWRLYDTRSDFAEARDLAGERPDVLRQLQQLWWGEAGRNGVFPLDDRPLRELIAARGPVGLFAQRSIVLRPGTSHIPYPSAVTGSQRDMDITVFFTADGPADGVLVSSGNVQGGYLMYVKDAELWFEHSHLREHTSVCAPLSAMTVSVAARVRIDEGQPSGSVELVIDGRPAAQAIVPRLASHLSFWGLDVGSIPNSTFSTAVVPPFAVPTRSVDRVEFVVAERTDLGAYADLLAAQE